MYMYVWNEDIRPQGDIALVRNYLFRPLLLRPFMCVLFLPYSHLLTVLLIPSCHFRVCTSSPVSKQPFLPPHPPQGDSFTQMAACLVTVCATKDRAMREIGCRDRLALPQHRLHARRRGIAPSQHLPPHPTCLPPFAVPHCPTPTFRHRCPTLS